jgi:hypothetical protein
LVVNTLYDPQTQTLAGFEEQVSHHGGLGGPQNHAFVLRPLALPYDGLPIVGAPALHRVLRGWRRTLQEPKTDSKVESVVSNEQLANK